MISHIYVISRDFLINGATGDAIAVCGHQWVPGIYPTDPYVMIYPRNDSRRTSGGKHDECPTCERNLPLALLAAAEL